MNVASVGWPFHPSSLHRPLSFSPSLLPYLHLSLKFLLHDVFSARGNVPVTYKTNYRWKARERRVKGKGDSSNGWLSRPPFHLLLPGVVSASPRSHAALKNPPLIQSQPRHLSNSPRRGTARRSIFTSFPHGIYFTSSWGGCMSV